MKHKIFVLITLLAISLLSAQRLPTGSYHPNRERTYDIIHYKADLRIDWKTKQVAGEASVRLTPLGNLSSISLDAYRINVSTVKEEGGKTLPFSSSDASLTIDLGRSLRPADTITVLIRYSATPTAGMYFIDPSPGTNNQPAIFTYGEGGIHANWLPIYSDNNDKFSTEMIATVNKPHTVISNGKLLSTKENSDGTRTFHWSQSLPHSNYLIALFAGEYVGVPLRPAFGEIPLTAWVHPGQEELGRSVFQRTPDMVEFFSNKFSFRYPWDKYDQVSAYDYAIGAMENTGVTGHNDRILRASGQLEEFNPDFENHSGNWTAEAIISHELAHHWFGDNTTCRNLANIWINESFASYLMMLWDEHRLGKESLQAHTWMALQAYLKYIRKSHIIRPLEYRYFDSRSEIYNTETTYQKGAIVLNMLRWIMGDDDFFKALGYFQNKHKFSNVESSDLKTAIEESTGRNVRWFFEQWVWGGGHPIFEVSADHLPGRRKLEVTVKQVQPIVDGQGLFELPVEIRIDVNGKSTRHVVWIEREEDHFTFDVSGKPDMVSFDGRGALVCELHFERDLDELLYQLANDELPGRLWALHQLVDGHASNPRTLEAFRSLLTGTAPAFLKAEATLQLQQIHSPEAEALLVKQIDAKDYHIRKAAAMALGSRYTEASTRALRTLIKLDKNDEVAATAIVSLAAIDATLSADFFKEILSRASWYETVKIAALTAIEQMGDGKFIPLLRGYTSLRYNYGVRQQALKSWAACAPTDPPLTDALISFAKTDILPVRTTAIGLLGKLKISKAIPALEEIAARNGDSDMRKAASDAIEEIKRIR